MNRKCKCAFLSKTRTFLSDCKRLNGSVHVQFLGWKFDISMPYCFMCWWTCRSIILLDVRFLSLLIISGKTYTGLKIAQALLTNQEVWKGVFDSSPMLVVCYTNHALDQFLEGRAPAPRHTELWMYCIWMHDSPTLFLLLSYFQPQAILEKCHNLCFTRYNSEGHFSHHMYQQLFHLFNMYHRHPQVHLFNIVHQRHPQVFTRRYCKSGWAKQQWGPDAFQSGGAEKVPWLPPQTTATSSPCQQWGES